MSNFAAMQFRQEQLSRRSMAQNDDFRQEEQEDLARRQSTSQPRIDLNQFGYTTRRVSKPADRFTSQEDRSTQARQENNWIQDQVAEEDILYAPQHANWRFYSQFQDPVQGTQRRPREPAQEAAPAGDRQETHNFLRPETPRARPETPRNPRPELPRLIRTETHPPRQREIRGQRENAQHLPQAPVSQEQALRLQLELTTQLASLQAKVLEANDNKAAKITPAQSRENPVEGEISEDEYSEEEEVDWSGKVIDKEDSKEASISNDGFTYWNSLVGTDEAGLKTLKFKRPYKQPLTKMQAFSEVSFKL